MEYQGKTYQIKDYFESIHLQGAEALGTYTDSYVQGQPAVTVHSYGKGKAYYIAFKSDGDFLQDFYGELMPPCYQLPEGVSLRTRESDTAKYLMLQNWNTEAVEVNLPFEAQDLLRDCKVSGSVQLAGYETLVLKQG